jgi:hypothetical protein
LLVFRPLTPSTDIGSSCISARSHQSVNSAQSAAPKNGADQAIQNPQKQIVSRRGRVPLNDIGSIAQLLGGAISTGACVSKITLPSGAGIFSSTPPVPHFRAADSGANIRVRCSCRAPHPAHARARSMTPVGRVFVGSDSERPNVQHERNSGVRRWHRAGDSARLWELNGNAPFQHEVAATASITRRARTTTSRMQWRVWSPRWRRAITNTTPWIGSTVLGVSSKTNPLGPSTSEGDNRWTGASSDRPSPAQSKHEAFN